MDPQSPPPEMILYDFDMLFWIFSWVLQGLTHEIQPTHHGAEKACFAELRGN